MRLAYLTGRTAIEPILSWTGYHEVTNTHEDHELNLVRSVSSWLSFLSCLRDELSHETELIAHALERLDAGAHREEPDGDAENRGRCEAADHQELLLRTHRESADPLEEINRCGPAEQDDHHD